MPTVPPSPLEVLLPLRPSGALPPLFCIHPGGGLSWSYSGLMRHLPAERPIYGLQARGITEPHGSAHTRGNGRGLSTFIRKVQPTGPYHLLGWSFGGLVAHAMATRIFSGGRDGCFARRSRRLSDRRTFTHRTNRRFDGEKLLADQLRALGYYRGDGPLRVSSALGAPAQRGRHTLRSGGASGCGNHPGHENE